MNDKPDNPTEVETHDKSTTIIVNGRERKARAEEIPFDDLVNLAFDDPQRGPQIIFTITFRNAGGRLQEGELVEGEKLKVREGTIVNVTRTDQS